MICKLVFNLICNQSKMFVNSCEDPNVDDMKPNSNNRDGSEDSGGCSTGAVLD